jgi:mono/diheme cytochrome c family protein
MYRPLLISALAAVTLCAFAQSAPAPSPTPAPAVQDPDALPAGAGKDLVQRACVACHNVRRVTAARETKEEWNQTVDKMIEHGAILTDSEADTIVQYLSANFGAPAKTPEAPASSSAPTANPQ